MAPRTTQHAHIALIGAGLMGSLHARVITQSPDAELSCIVDPDQEVGELLAERYQTRWVPKLDDLGPFDAVIIATPTTTHSEWGHAAIEAGRPVLIEKPVSEDLAEAQALVAAARRHGVPLMCGLLERFNAAVLTTREIVEEPIHITTVRHSPYADRISTGVAYDLLIHDLDLVLCMAEGQPTELRAHFGYCHPKSLPYAEDVAEVTVQFDTGLVAALSASRVSQRKVRTIMVAELERMVEIDLLRQNVTIYRHVGAELLEGRGTAYRQQTVIDIPAIANTGEPLAGQLDHFLALARGEVDSETELASIEPPHRLTAQAVELSRRNVTRT